MRGCAKDDNVPGIQQAYIMKENAIEIKDLVKEYDGTRAVNGISLNIGRGEIFSLLGPNGAGKTTTVEILEGIRSSTSGSALVFGLDPIRDRSALLRRVGILPQDFSFIDLTTPLEILDFYITCYGTGLKPEDVLAQVDLLDKKESLFDDMSGGQKQKLGIAIALCNNPDLLFLDEPTAGLDPISRMNIWKVIENMKKMGKTVFLTTHYLEEAEKLSDRVAIINRGVILEEGTPEQLISKNGSGSVLSFSGTSISVTQLQDAGFSSREGKNGIEVRMRDSSDFFSLVEFLKKSGEEPKELTMKRDSLEDVFIKLVGRVEDD